MIAAYVPYATVPMNSLALGRDPVRDAGHDRAATPAIHFPP
jgi:hypothetical protein